MEICNEEAPLLSKNYQGYSQRTAITVSTSDSCERLEEEFSTFNEPTKSVLGSVVVVQIPLGHEDALVTEKDDVQHAPEPFVVDEDVHFLEMGLTRNLSILPDDVVQVAVGTHNEDTECLLVVAEPTPPKDSFPAIPKSAYLLLLTAIVSLSSIGPLLQLQGGATPSMKVVWRMAGTSILLLPAAISDVYHHGGFPVLTNRQWTNFFISTACYDVLTLAFILSLDYTAVGNAVILSNSLALMLLVGKVFVGDPITYLEGFGALVAFGGAALCSRDSSSSHGGSNALWGDAIALVSALGGVGYLIFAKKTRQVMPMYLFMFLTMSVGGLMALWFQVFVMGEQVSVDMDAQHGVFGFLALQPDRLPLEFCMVIVCNIFGTMGYVRAMQYFDNLVISSAALLEPVVAEFMASALGVGHLPGLGGWFGNLLVAAGTFAVIYVDGKRVKGKESPDSLEAR